MMSKYKTPIRIQLDSSRRINQVSNKYKLPFKKDEKNPEKMYSLSERQNSFIISSEVKVLTHDSQRKVANSSKYSLKSQPEQKNQSIFAVNQQEELVKNQQLTQNLNQEIESSKKENEKMTQKAADDLSLLKRKKLKLQKSLQLKIRSSSKNRIKLNSLNRSEKYQISTNRYTDQDSKNAQGLHQNEKDITNFIENNSRSSCFKRKTPIKPKNVHTSLKKAQVQSWEILSRSTENQQTQINSLKQKVLLKLLQRRRLNETQIERPKANAKNLTSLALWKHERNDNIYGQLPLVNQSSQTSKISNEQEEQMIKKLRQTIYRRTNQLNTKLSMTLETYKEQYLLLKRFNPFFKKVNELGGCMLLSIGKFKFLKAEDLLFTEADPISHLSIIIMGKVALSKTYNHYHHFKSFGLAGQTLGQQALFDDSKSYHSRLSKNSFPIFYKLQAKAKGEVCILRINLRKFYKMCSQLSILGEQNLFSLIENLFKVNYLRKKSLIHQELKARLQTQILGSLRKKGNSHVFY